jgi:peptide/nickel transport system permease protein
MVSLMVFAITEVLPGDAASAILGQEATEEARTVLRGQLGLDRPASVRYLDWMHGMMRGDFGTSLAADMPVTRVIGQRLANTLTLAIATALVAVPLSIGLGMLAAAFPGSPFDRTLVAGALLTIAMPEFLVGLLLVLLFAVYLRWLPTTTTRIDFSSPTALLRALTLPGLTLIVSVQAHMIRMTRAAILDVMRRPFIEMALLKGASRYWIIVRHALPNALAPIVNVVALNLGYLVSGVIIVEVVFTYPGLGRLMVDSVTTRDVPMVQAIAMIFCAAYILLTLTADIAAILANPRLRSPT